MTEPAPALPEGLPEGAIFAGRIRWHRNELRPSGAVVNQVFSTRVATAARTKDQPVAVFSRPSGADGLQQYENIRLGTSGGKWRISGATALVKALALPPDIKHVALWHMPSPDERLFILASNEGSAGGGAVASDQAGEESAEPAEQPKHRKAHKRQMRQERNRQLRQRRSAEAETEAAEAEGHNNSSGEGAMEAVSGGEEAAEGLKQDGAADSDGHHSPAMRTRGALSRVAAGVPTGATPKRSGRASRTAVKDGVGNGGTVAAAGADKQAETAVQEAADDGPNAEAPKLPDQDMGQPQQKQPPKEQPQGTEQQQRQRPDTPQPVASEPTVPQQHAQSQGPAAVALTKTPDVSGGGIAAVGASGAAAGATTGPATQCSSRVTVTAHMLRGGYLVLDPGFATCAGLSAAGSAHAASLAVDLLEPNGAIVHGVLALTVVAGDDSGAAGVVGASAAGDRTPNANGVISRDDSLDTESLAGAVALAGLGDWMRIRSIEVGSVVLVSRCTAGLYYISVESGSGRGEGGEGANGLRVDEGGGSGDVGPGRCSGADGSQAARQGNVAKDSVAGAPDKGECPLQGGALAKGPATAQAIVAANRVASTRRPAQRRAGGGSSRRASVGLCPAVLGEPVTYGPPEGRGGMTVGEPHTWNSEAVARLAARGNVLSVTTSATHLLVAQLLANKWARPPPAGAAAAAYG